MFECENIFTWILTVLTDVQTINANPRISTTKIEICYGYDRRVAAHTIASQTIIKIWEVKPKEGVIVYSLNRKLHASQKYF